MLLPLLLSWLLMVIVTVRASMDFPLAYAVGASPCSKVRRRYTVKENFLCGFHHSRDFGRPRAFIQRHPLFLFPLKYSADDSPLPVFLPSCFGDKERCMGIRQ